MNYNYYIEDNTIYIENLIDFNLVATLESGQCFRWDKISEEEYIGVAHNRVIVIGQKDNLVWIENSDENDFLKIWVEYFSFSQGYEKIKKELSKDPIMKEAVKCSNGVYTLKQELHETIISYIISANNNILRIKKIIKTLSENFGEEIEYNNEIYYSFPSMEKLATLSIDEINIAKAGFRNRYIHETSRSVIKDNFNEKDLMNLNYEDSVKALTKYLGIGNKVADCILLFTKIHTCAFPVDVWIKRVMEHLYIKKEVTADYVRTYAIDKFKENAGYANQYLFSYARNMKI